MLKCDFDDLSKLVGTCLKAIDSFKGDLQVEILYSVAYIYNFVLFNSKIANSDSVSNEERRAY